MATVSGSSLNRKLIFGCMAMLGFSLLLSISLIFIFKSSFDRADRNLHLLSIYRQILVAANCLSAERGPTNAVLGEEPSLDSNARRKLAQFRAKSDDALAAIWPAPSSDAGLLVSVAAITQVQERLRTARAAVDELNALKRSDRSAENIAAAVERMFAVIDAMDPVTAGAIVRIVAQDQTLAGPVLMAQMLGELREYAGRFASHVMPFLAARQPLPVRAQNEVNRTRGRIYALWQMAELQGGLYDDDARLKAARNDINTRFFGAGLPLIDATAAHTNGDYGLTTGELTDRYVPTLEPVERMRTTFLALTIDRPAAERSAALQWLIYVSLVTGIIVLANIALIISARRLVFRPLLTARDQIIALSEGQEMAEVASPTKAKEMRHLFDALEGLRTRLGERLIYTERLKVEAETDALTGLMNRRSLDRIGMGGPEFSEVPTDVALILMDIDRFKAINDTYGHPVGDLVLKRVAEIVRDAAGETSLAARYGGEEMAIVVTDVAHVSANALAERIRADLAESLIVMNDAGKIKVTASFGVAAGRRGATDWPRMVKLADEALYRAKSSGRNRVCRAKDDAAGEGYAGFHGLAPEIERENEPDLEGAC